MYKWRECLEERILQKTLAFKFLKFLFPKFSCPHLCARILGLLIFFRMTKGTVAKERRKDKSVADEKKGKRYAHRTRVGIDFDPKPSILSSQKEVCDYLVRYRHSLSSKITVEFCPATTDVKGHLPLRGCIFTPKILALGVSLPLTRFI